MPDKISKLKTRGTAVRNRKSGTDLESLTLPFAYTVQHWFL